MENHRSTSTIDRTGRDALLPWEPLERHTATAFTLAGTCLLASLFVPFGLIVIIDWSWLVGIALVGLAVLTAAIGLLGLQPRVRIESPWLAFAGAMFATAAGLAGLVVLVLTGLTGAAIHLPSMEFSVGQQAFVFLSLTMAAGYALGFLSFGIGSFRTSSISARVGNFLIAGGVLLLVPVGGGIAQLGVGIAMPAWIVFASLGLVAVDTVAVGTGLRSTN